MRTLIQLPPLRSVTNSMQPMYDRTLPDNIMKDIMNSIIGGPLSVKRQMDDVDTASSVLANGAQPPAPKLPRVAHDLVGDGLPPQSQLPAANGAGTAACAQGSDGTLVCLAGGCPLPDLEIQKIWAIVNMDGEI